MVNRVEPEAEIGKGAEMGMVSAAETGTGGVVGTEMESEDDTGTETAEDTGLARGGELKMGIGEEGGPGSEDGTWREEMVIGAGPGTEAVETEDRLASYVPDADPSTPIISILSLPCFPYFLETPSSLKHKLKNSKNTTI